MRQAALALAFDHPTPTFRHAKFQEYKATRERMEPDLIAQIDVMREIVRVAIQGAKTTWGGRPA